MKRIRGKLRYGNFLRIVIDAIATVGIKISPIYLVEEMLRDGLSPKLHPDIQAHTIDYVNREDVKALADIPFSNIQYKKCITRIEQGQKCLLMKCDGELAAAVWVDHEKCSISGCEFPLHENEAYLFHAYTVVNYRGKGIAPYLRYQCYTRLAQEGRTIVYSAVDVFNASARKVLAKLHARTLELWMRIFFFGKWRIVFNVRRYHDGSHTIRDNRARSAV